MISTWGGDWGYHHLRKHPYHISIQIIQYVQRFRMLSRLEELTIHDKHWALWTRQRFIFYVHICTVEPIKQICHLSSYLYLFHLLYVFLVFICLFSKLFVCFWYFSIYICICVFILSLILIICLSYHWPWPSYSQSTMFKIHDEKGDGIQALGGWLAVKSSWVRRAHGERRPQHGQLDDRVDHLDVRQGMVL